MHSMTRRRPSPGPRGRLHVAMAFSQISSRGCGHREDTQQTKAIPGTRLVLRHRAYDTCVVYSLYDFYWMWHLDASFRFCGATYPSFERLPPSQSVAHVSENPQDDDARFEICDSGLRGQTDRETNRTECQHKEQHSRAAHIRNRIFTQAQR